MTAVYGQPVPSPAALQALAALRAMPGGPLALTVSRSVATAVDVRTDTQQVTTRRTSGVGAWAKAAQPVNAALAGSVVDTRRQRPLLIAGASLTPFLAPEVGDTVTIGIRPWRITQVTPMANPGGDRIAPLYRCEVG